MWASLSLLRNVPLRASLKIADSRPKLRSSRLSVQGSGCAFHRRPQIARPVESRTTIVRRPNNTITVLITERNIMLMIDFEPQEPLLIEIKGVRFSFAF